MFSLSWRESMAYLPLIFRGNRAIPLFSAAGPFKVMKRKLKEIGGLHQFRHHHPAIERGESGVVDVDVPSSF